MLTLKLTPDHKRLVRRYFGYFLKVLAVGAFFIVLTGVQVPRGGAGVLLLFVASCVLVPTVAVARVEGVMLGGWTFIAAESWLVLALLAEYLAILVVRFCIGVIVASGMGFAASRFSMRVYMTVASLVMVVLFCTDFLLFVVVFLWLYDQRVSARTD